MNRLAMTLVTAAVVSALAGSAQAVSVGLNVYNTTKANGADLSANSVNVDVTDTGAAYSFTFTNDSTVTSSITKLYFDGSLASVLAGSGSLSPSAGVDYRPATVISDPPFAANIGWTGSLALYRAKGTDDDTKIANGIAHGGLESLTVSFAKVGGTVLQDVIDLLTNTGGIVAHLINLEDSGLRTNIDLTTLASQGGAGGQDDNDHSPVVIPTPASAAAGLALLGLLAARRRRDA